MEKKAEPVKKDPPKPPLEQHSANLHMIKKSASPNKATRSTQREMEIKRSRPLDYQMGSSKKMVSKSQSRVGGMGITSESFLAKF